jgi:TonB family protein
MMTVRRKLLLAATAVLVVATLSINWVSADAQSRLTYPELLTALNARLPNQVFKSKPELIKWLILQIKSRKVDKPLTTDRENDLRLAGATDELIDAVRNNSPALSKPSPSPELKDPVVDLGELSGRARNLVKPEYTEEGLQAGIEGQVKLALQLDSSGRVTSVSVLTTLGGGLAGQAVAAAQRSTFAPAMVNGKPSRGSGTITYNFKINKINVEATVANADTLRKQGNCDGAITEYARVINVSKTQLRAFEGRGFCYLQKLDYDRALADFESASKLDDANAQTWVHLAAAYDFKGDPKDATIAYGKAITLNPQIERLPMMRCLFIEKPGITIEQAQMNANSIIDACSTFAPNAPEFLTPLVYVKRGIGYNLKSDFDRAIIDFENARRLSPQFAVIQKHLVVAYNSRGQIHFQKKEYKDALADVSRAIDIDPRNPTPYVNRCVIQLYGWKEYDKAIDDCNAAIRLTDKSSMAYNHRGYANEMKKNLSAALADYTKALEIDPKNDLAQNNLKRIRPNVKSQ